MSSFVGTRRGHATVSASAGSKAGSRLSSATRPTRTVRRAPVAPEPAHGLPTEIQRSRLVAAAIRSLDEVGYVNASVAHITSRARVSRRTFYELFADREQCLLAAFEDVLGLLGRELAAARLDGLPWRERVRLGLWTVLSFFEREPALARLCVVESLQGDAALLARRAEVLESLAAFVDAGREQGAKGAQATPLTAEGLVGATLSILYTRVQRRDSEPLTALLGELMGLIVLPYLGAAAAKRELARPLPTSTTAPRKRAGGEERFADDPFAGVTMRLTYRTMRVLECVASEPGASNRRVGALAEVPDQGQISKLLSRMERLGLLVNTGKARPKGEANAWELTELGERVIRHLNLDTQLQHAVNTTKETR
jgi:AcrR family transcriptional regulator